MDRSTALLLAACVVLASTAAAASVAAAGVGSGSATVDSAGPAVIGPGPVVVESGPTAVGSGPAAVAPGAPGSAARGDAYRVPPTPTENTTARLLLPTIRLQRTGFGTADLGMGSTFQSRAVDVRGRHRQLTIQRTLTAAEDTGARRSAVDGALIEVDEWLTELERRERDAVLAHADGRITTETLVRRLARVDAEARRISATLQNVRAVVETDIDLSDLETRLVAIEARAESLQGPIRERAGEVAAGEASPTRIYAETSGDGVVLATLDGDTYVRETTFYTNRLDRDGTMSNSEASQRAEELYPWTAENAHSTSIQGFGRETYRLRFSHPQGELVAYVDGDTEDVYREIQFLSVPLMPTVDTVTREGENYRIVLRRTYAGGPLVIRVEDPVTDAAVNVQVTVNGRRIGETGLDGTILTLQPRPPYSVTATRGTTSYNVTITEPGDEQLPD